MAKTLVAHLYISNLFLQWNLTKTKFNWSKANLAPKTKEKSTDWMKTKKWKREEHCDDDSGRRSKRHSTLQNKN